MRVLLCAESEGSSFASARARTPAAGLTRLGHSAYVTSLSLHSHDTASRERWIRGYDPGARRMFPPTQVAVLRLYDQDESVSIRRATEAGQLVYMDCDDDFWHIPEWAPSRRYLKRSGRYLHGTPPEINGSLPRSLDLDHIEANMAAATGVLVTTPALAASVRAAVPGAPVHVVPNAIDAHLYYWPRRPAEHQPLRLAWMGTTTDNRHLALCPYADHLRSLLDDCGAEFWHLGHRPGAPDLEEATGIPVAGRLEWRPNRELPEMLAQVDLGIICREVGSAFTEAQSTVSGLAYMAAGVPFVASLSQEYLGLVGGGLCYSTPDQCAELLGALMRRPGWRAELRAAARAGVVDHSPQTMAKAMLEVFRADAA